MLRKLPFLTSSLRPQASGFRAGGFPAARALLCSRNNLILAASTMTLARHTSACDRKPTLSPASAALRPSVAIFSCCVSRAMRSGRFVGGFQAGGDRFAFGADEIPDGDPSRFVQHPIGFDHVARAALLRSFCRVLIRAAASGAWSDSRSSLILASKARPAPDRLGLRGDARLGLALGRAEKLGGPPDVFRQQGEAFRMFGGGVQLGVGQFGFRADDGLTPPRPVLYARRINLLEFGHQSTPRSHPLFPPPCPTGRDAPQQLDLAEQKHRLGPIDVGLAGLAGGVLGLRRREELGFSFRSRVKRAMGAGSSPRRPTGR